MTDPSLLNTANQLSIFAEASAACRRAEAIFKTARIPAHYHTAAVVVADAAQFVELI